MVTSDFGDLRGDELPERGDKGMAIHPEILRMAAAVTLLNLLAGLCLAQAEEVLPPGVKAVWDLGHAYRETTPTRERISVNGLWRWQPAKDVADQVPAEKWGFFKVPGCWPGIGDYQQKDCQTVHPHPSWKNEKLGEVVMAWYQREFAVPADWAGRRITVSAECLNSGAIVFVDGKKAGEMQFPRGEVDITSACRPAAKQVLSMFVVAMPLKKGLMPSFGDTNSVREVKATVRRRGLCGDVFLVGAPAGARVADVKVDPSVRKGEITFDAALQGLDGAGQYALRAQITQNGGKSVGEFTSKPFKAGDLRDGRTAFTEKWKAEKLWDTHTPQNQYSLQLSLLDAGGKVLDCALPVRFGFREFWIDGRDLYLNCTRIFLSSVPLDNAQVGAAWSTYDAAKDSMLRLRTFGMNFLYTHNYGCEPGAHLAFDEILRAADDVGMLISLSQPHFGQYDWEMADADQKNGYAGHAEAYVRVAQNHPSVVCYSTSHNATGDSEDMNPDLMGCDYPVSGSWSLGNRKKAARAEAIIRRLDPSRFVYHHSSGNFGTMHTSNFYPNWAPVQELSDWFETWSSKGVRPVFTCEYGAPFTWDWAMYRGWYPSGPPKGKRTFGSAVVPWEFCLAEWNSQFLGDPAFKISENEKANLRFEAKQIKAGKEWHRWDYPHQLGSSDFDERYPVFAMYYTDNFRAFRTWGVSATSPWEHQILYRPRDGVNRNARQELKVDWDNLQRPGFSPDYLEGRYEGMDMAYERSDWVSTLAAKSLERNNMPLLAYIGGKPAHFTSKDHNFVPGEPVEKQIIVINNSRETVSCECDWSLGLPQAATGSKKVTVKTGEQERIPMRLELGAGVAPGKYELTASAKFSSGETQQDSFTVHVLPPPQTAAASGKIAVFDPKGETGKLLSGIRVSGQAVDAKTDLAPYDVLIIGKGALTPDGPGPDIGRVREGLKVIVFEQEPEVLEKRLGFRIAAYGLRQVFKRVPDHPLLAGLEPENLRDWRGEATILPPRLKSAKSPEQNYGFVFSWCGIPVTRIYRCGCRGNVASALIEKPACGDFLPIVDGGFSLQYSPLLEYREGQGLVLFCQMDVTGRTENDPAADRLARNIIAYVSGWKPRAERKAVYAGDPAGKAHLERAGLTVGAYGGGELTPDHVLVVGPGGGKALSAGAAAVGSWLKAGGQLLAIALDEEDANALLPAKVSMKKGEHIAAYFESWGADTLFAGIGPADVHNRDPRELPLVSGQAKVVGDGVLAQAEGSKVVFCQMAPWQFQYKIPQNVKRTFRRASCLVSRLLGNMGVRATTPLLSRFSSPADDKEKAGRWLQGLYLDQPEEWDDPYRFFRW